MQFFLNQATNLLVRAMGLNTTLTSVTFKARDTLVLDVWFHDDKALGVTLPETGRIVFALKNGYGSGAATLALVDEWTAVDSEGSPGLYRGLLPLNTVPLVAAIGDLAKITALGEFSWSADAGVSWESSNTLDVTIQNDVYKGVEGTPVPMPSADDDWLAHGHAQSLTDPQKAQIIANLGGFGFTAGTIAQGNSFSILEFTGADPNIPETITITGITDPVLNFSELILQRFGDFGGFASWETDDNEFYVRHTGSAWRISDAVGILYRADKTSGVVSPVGLSDWSIIAGDGQPIVTGDNPTGTFTGQWCKSTTAWWQWDGTAWLPRFTLAGDPIAYNATLGAFRKLTISGADGSETITISAL